MPNVQQPPIDDLKCVITGKTIGDLAAMLRRVSIVWRGRFVGTALAGMLCCAASGATAAALRAGGTGAANGIWLHNSRIFTATKNDIAIDLISGLGSSGGIRESARETGNLPNAR